MELPAQPRFRGLIRVLGGSVRAPVLQREGAARRGRAQGPAAGKGESLAVLVPPRRAGNTTRALTIVMARVGEAVLSHEGVFGRRPID